MSIAGGVDRAPLRGRGRPGGPGPEHRERQAPILVDLWRRLRNPLNALLLMLAAIIYIYNRALTFNYTTGLTVPSAQSERVPGTRYIRSPMSLSAPGSAVRVRLFFV